MTVLGVALCAAALLEDRVASAGAVGSLATLVTNDAYAAGTPMGILVPGLLNVGDVPHLAALCAPHRLLIAEARTPQGQALNEMQLREAFALTRSIYGLTRRETALTLQPTLQAREAVAALG